MKNKEKIIAKYHLPGLFEFYEFYKVFLPLYGEHKEWFYDWAEIASIYGAPEDCLWSGGRFGAGEENPREVLEFVNQYGISARLTFSNSLLQEEHLGDEKCNELCAMFENGKMPSGVIVHSDLLLNYLKKNYPDLYFISSTTKVLTDANDFVHEVRREEFQYVVPDFRMNKRWEVLNSLGPDEKEKIEFLCNECCYVGCKERKQCYENVSRRVLAEDCEEHICHAPGGEDGYLFSKAMEHPMFIGINEILHEYLPQGFSNFKIEGRSLGNAMILEFLLYYLVKPEYQIHVREKIYLDSMLDLF